MTRPRRMTYRPRAVQLGVVILGVSAALLAGCHPPKPKGSAVSAESHAPGTTMASTPAACAAYPADTPGVIHAYCNGSAVVKLNIDGVDHLLKGGVCSNAGGAYALDLGIVAGPQLAGPKPDFVGLKTTGPAGPFTDAAITLNIGGKTITLHHNSGQVGPTGGDFTGVGRRGHHKVVGTFTC